MPSKQNHIKVLGQLGVGHNVVPNIMLSPIDFRNRMATEAYN